MKDHFLLRNMGTNEDIPLISRSVTLGRTPNCEIVIDSSEASRQHARITLEHGRLTLEDLGSTNGTRLNGRRISQPEVLGGGDIIVIGQTHLMVVAPGSAEHNTILGGRLGNADENYVVEQEDPDVTGLRMSFPKPPGWSAKDDFGESKSATKQPLDVLALEMKRQSVGVENTVAVFMIVSEQGRNTLLPLRAGKAAWTLGRTADNDIEICHVTISSLHAVVREKSLQWQIEDQESTNGTRVNGKKIDKHALQDGDTVSLGKIDLVFKSL
jgi:pSer/pThr/pTyr-binding forkhead associated (FHA) protein